MKGVNLQKNKEEGTDGRVIKEILGWEKGRLP